MGLKRFKKGHVEDDINLLINFILTSNILNNEDLCIDLINFVNDNDLIYLFMSKVYVKRINNRLNDLGINNIDLSNI